jgi:leucyl aminopeptidase
MRSIGGRPLGCAPVVDVQSTTAAPLDTDADTICVGVFEDEGVAHDLPGETLRGLLDGGEARRTFKHLALTHLDGRRILLAGLGERPAFDGERARAAAAAVEARAAELGARSLCWEVPHHVDDDVVSGLVEGTMLHAYRFDRYRPRGGGRPGLDQLLLSAHHDVSAVVSRAAVVTAAQNRARDLANTPGNDLTPAALADYAASLEGVRVTILAEDEIAAAGMGAFLAVAQGSVREPRLIRIEYDGATGSADAGRRPPSAEEPLPLALIGKAITFDAGGLALKSAGKMHEMKFDMAGGAAVIEAMGAIAALQLPIRVLALVGAAENLPSGSAVKPGDIVTARTGTTIEVNNPDAEGRLVLGELISLAVEEGAARIVDVATLTGAVVTALGSIHAGLLSNDDALADALLAAASDSGEPLWRLPLHPEYAAMVKGRYAQLTNLTERREAMTITAAEFLHHFAGKTPWAHIDVAGTAWDVPRPYYVGKGATGFGVRLLVALAAALAAPVHAAPPH